MFSLHKISVSVIFIFLSVCASGSDPYTIPAGASEAGMSYSCIMKQGFWSSFQNQALLPDNGSLRIGFNYEDRFNIAELGTRTAGVIIPAGRTVIGTLYSNFGYRDFHRHTANIACGMKLSQKMSAGIQIDYFSEVAPGKYSNLQILTFEAGIIYMPSEKTRIGIHLFNPLPGSLRKSYLPSSLRAGAGLFLNEVLFASAELEAVTGRELVLRTGFDYHVGKIFSIRGGFSSENSSFSMGMGFEFRSVNIDLGLRTHERLGISSSVSLIFNVQEHSFINR